MEYAASSKITLRLKEAFAPVTTAFAKNLESLRKTQKIIKKYGEKIAQKTYRLIQKNPKIVDVEKGIVSSIKKTAKELSKEKGTVGRVTEKVSKDIGKSKSEYLKDFEKLSESIKQNASSVKKVSGVWEDIFEHAKIKLNHIFSEKHIARGILKLGPNKKEILESFKNVVRDVHSNNLLKNGINQIRTRINGFDVEIRVFLEDGKILNFDAFRGFEGRMFKDSLINWNL